MTRFFLFVIACINISTSSCSQNQAKISPQKPIVFIDTNKINLKIIEAKKYVKVHQMNDHLYILFDIGMHSGLERFYIIKEDKIIDKGCVSHGCGSMPWGEMHTKDKAIISNTPDSHCSSIGKYKIGKRGVSQWGIKINYLLHGLEANNKNALARQIVLHSWELVSKKENYPTGTPEGWGCPAISNEMMQELDKELKKENMPVLLWIYE